MATKLSDQMITELKQHFSMTSFASSINVEEDESFTEEDAEPTEVLGGALID